MRRSVLVLPAFLLLVACSSTKAPRHTLESIDPARDPSVVGTIDEATREAAENAAEGAEKGRRVGQVAGVLAAIFGGPEVESVDDMVDRYRRTRDAATAIGAVIGATSGAIEGGQRGYAFDEQFAELHALQGVEVLRPVPDLIEIRFTDRQLVDQIALILLKGAQRNVTIEAEGTVANEIRDELIAHGLSGDTLYAYQNEEVAGVLLSVRPVAEMAAESD